MVVEGTRDIFSAPVWQAIKIALYVAGASLMVLTFSILALKIRQKNYDTLVDQEVMPPLYRKIKTLYKRGSHDMYTSQAVTPSAGRTKPRKHGCI